MFFRFLKFGFGLNVFTFYFLYVFGIVWVFYLDSVRDFYRGVVCERKFLVSKGDFVVVFRVIFNYVFYGFFYF